MYWDIRCESAATASDLPAQGRFVLHRHVDEAGAHLDLRLEQRGYLDGFRIAATQLAGENSAREKAPHPLRWLDADGDAIREEEGGYCWHDRDGESGVLELRGKRGVYLLHLQRVHLPDVETVRAMVAACHEARVEIENAPQLLRDGATARQRTMERFCALGRELEGAAFDEKVWRRTLAPLSLSDVQDHLRSLEVRFDLKYPPQPVSVAETLPEDGMGERNSQVLEIARG